MSTQAEAPDARQELAFGLFDWIDAAPGRTVGEVYEGRLRLLAEADRGGVTVYPLAEHHGTPLGLAPSPAVFLAAAARTTRRIRLAPTTFVVPLYDPLRLGPGDPHPDQLAPRPAATGGVGRGQRLDHDPLVPGRQRGTEVLLRCRRIGRDAPRHVQRLGNRTRERFRPACERRVEQVLAVEVQHIEQDGNDAGRARGDP